MNNRYFNKDAEHRELKALVDDWVARGGKITQYPPGKAKGLPSSSQLYEDYEYRIHLGDGSYRKAKVRIDE